ncbi:MAG: phospholipid carrier-dependent glycosyltransferase [Candidatus Brocadiae bacterium]|nr:phospholipid carrier-dependent glycosyltransferase [Candidatus Brocadiia bacterium]
MGRTEDAAWGERRPLAAEYGGKRGPKPAAPAPERRHWRRCLHWLILLGILAGAFFLRSLDARHVFDGDSVVIPGHDTHYHLRRIQHAVAASGRVPARDAWVNAPEGADIYWPAGFDLGLAALCRLTGAEPWSSGVERRCAWAIPVLGVGVVLATWWVGRLWRGPGTGLLAAALVAVVPSAISVSMVGRVDHDVAAILAATVAFALYLHALRSEARRPRCIWAAAAGILLGGNLWIWPGAIVFVLLAAAASVTTLLVDDTPRHRDAALYLLTAVAVVARALCTASASARPLQVSHLYLSGFHLVLSWAGAISPVLLFLVFRYAPRRPAPRLLAGGASQALLWGLVLFAVPGVWRALRGAQSFVGATADVTVSTTGEGIGLLGRGWPGVAGDLTWAAAGLPLAALFVLWRAVRPDRRAGDWLIALWLAIGIALALGQRRFAAVLAVPLALSVGGSWVWLLRLAAARRSAARLAVCCALGGALAIAVVRPLDRWRPRSVPRSWELRAIRPALDWLQTAAPSPGDSHDFGARPRFAVMAFWHYGHWLTYAAGQANIACPFGNTPQHQLGLDRSQAFFGARTEAQAADLCRELGVRYVLSPELPVPLLVKQAGLDPRHLRQQRCVATSLHLHRGLQAPERDGPLEHFRLVAEFPAAWPSGRPYTTRVFEYTLGARIVIQAPGQGDVSLSIDIVDLLAPPLHYRAAGRTSADGVCELRVPYDTQRATRRCQAAGPARVVWQDGTREARAELDIPDEAVRTGATIRCDLH